jgi:hypothetical protein
LEISRHLKIQKMPTRAVKKDCRKIISRMTQDQPELFEPIRKGSFFASIKVIGKLAETLGVEPDEFLKRPMKRRGRQAL